MKICINDTDTFALLEKALFRIPNWSIFFPITDQQHALLLSITSNMSLKPHTERLLTSLLNRTVVALLHLISIVPVTATKLLIGKDSPNMSYTIREMSVDQVKEAGDLLAGAMATDPFMNWICGAKFKTQRVGRIALSSYLFSGSGSHCWKQVFRQ